MPAQAYLQGALPSAFSNFRPGSQIRQKSPPSGTHPDQSFFFSQHCSRGSLPAWNDQERSTVILTKCCRAPLPAVYGLVRSEEMPC